MSSTNVIGVISLVLWSLLVVQINAGKPPPKPDAIIEVQPTCSPNTTAPSSVQVKSDAPVFHAYAKCHGGFQFNFTEVSLAEQTLEVHFSGVQSLKCLFDKKRLSRTYTLQVYVVLGTDNGVILDEHFYLITCTYDPHTKQESAVKDFGRGLSPAQDVTVNQGGKARSKIDLAAVNVFGRNINDSLTLGTMIKLRATMRDSPKGEVSFHPLTCKASAPGAEYAILTAGCGDGRVFSEYEGFVTKGKVAFSPLFKTFRLKGARSLTFTCTYYVCNQDCEGTSCISGIVERYRRGAEHEHQDRHKRDTIEETEIGLVEVESPSEGRVMKKVFSTTVQYYIHDYDLADVVIDPNPSDDSNEVRMASGPASLRMSKESDDVMSDDDDPSDRAELVAALSLTSILALAAISALVFIMYKTKSRNNEAETEVGGQIAVRSYSPTAMENDSYRPGAR